MTPSEADRIPAPPIEGSRAVRRPAELPSQPPSRSPSLVPAIPAGRGTRKRATDVRGVAETVPGWFVLSMDRWRHLALRALLAVGLAGLMAGCETYGRADWKSRIGQYNWDQALQELGPPESEAKTSDGTRVADWVLSKSRTYSTAIRGPMFWSWSGQDVTTTAESHLMLTFAPDGSLRSWKRIYK